MAAEAVAYKFHVTRSTHIRYALKCSTSLMAIKIKGLPALGTAPWNYDTNPKCLMHVSLWNSDGCVKLYVVRIPSNAMQAMPNW